MGAWEMTYFENDGAMDYVVALKNYTDASIFRQTFESVLAEEDYLEVDLGQEAIAAAAIIASINSEFSIELSEETTEWLNEHKISVDAHLTNLAQRALSRVMQDDSEIYELWEEQDDFSQWKQSIKELVRALQFTP